MFSGAVTDCSSIKSREHNVSCIVESLENDYLHVDLSHISSSSFVAADPVTIFNLFEILDGLLDFMLEQIDLKSDSGGAICLEILVILLDSKLNKKNFCMCRRR